MKKLFLGILAAALFWGNISASLADAGSDTISFQKNSVLDIDYKKVFSSEWFFKTGGGDSVAEIRDLFYDRALPIFKYLFLFLGLIFWAVYISEIVSAGGDEEKISENRKTMGLSVIGFLMISLAVEIGRVFSPLKKSSDIIDVEGAKTIVQKIIAFLQVSIGIVAFVAIFYAAVQFIRASGDDEKIDESKKHLKWGFLGMIFAMLAPPLVNTVFYPADKTLGAPETKNFVVQLVGFLKFALSFLAVFAFAALVIAGFYLITSFGDEERESKAKTIVWSTLLGLVVIALAFVLVRTLVPS